MSSRFLLLLAIAASAGAARAAPPPAYEVVSRSSVAGAEVLAIEFQVAGALGLTSALLIRPTTPGPHPGLLYLHKLGPGGSSGQFKDEALALAAKGAISLLPQGRVPWRMKWAGDETDLAKGQGQLAEFEGALALLRAEAGIDKDRILLVGHDYGAMFGLVLAAENPDIRALVFLAFAPRYSDWKDFFNPRKKLTPAVYDGIMAPLDPMAALDKLRGRPLYLQFAKSDTYVSEETVAAIRAAAGAGPVFDVVDAPDTDHENLHKKGAEARVAWMENQLFSP